MLNSFFDAPDPSPFASFWMGGFEGADHINGRGVALDMADVNGHLQRLDEDYAAAAAQGILSVRESVGWRLAEPLPGRFDLDRLRRIAAAAQRHGVQVVWTFMHYGVPADVSLADDGLIERFARFCTTAADTLAPYADAPVYNLINEIGFLAWAVSETNLFHPFQGDPNNTGGRTLESGWVIKRRLVAAALAGIAAVRRVDPRAHFLHVEPMVHVVAPLGRPELQPLAEQIAGYQWQVWDMIEGRLEPQLGGHPEALDLIGVNYYHSGQWEVETERRLEWHLRDDRRTTLGQLLALNHDRYRRPLIVAETSHFGEGRSIWLNEVMTELRSSLKRGLPVRGVCLYPLIDRPDWEDVTHWHHSGMWDVPEVAGGSFGRRLCLEYAATLARWQGRAP